MQIIYKKIDELIPYENNPRHNDQAVDAVAASIKEFGFRNPIIIDKNNVIVAGHTRQKAAKQLGLTEVPCVMADDLTPEQVKAFRLADNKVSEISSWDFLSLGEELNELMDIFDMTDFGFDLLAEPVELKEIKIKPYDKAHVLISYDVDQHPEILEKLEPLEYIKGVEIEYTLT